MKKLAARVPVWWFPILLVALVGLWFYSHVAPEHFGECHEVAIAVYIGNSPTVRECQPFPATDFAIPVVLAFFFYLFAAGEGAGNWEITAPGGWGIKRRVGEAVNLLREEGQTLDQRAQAYFETLPGEPEERKDV